MTITKGFVTIEINLVVQAFLTDKYIPIGDMGMDIAHNVTGKIVKDGAKMSFMHAVQKGTFRTWILMRSYILLPYRFRRPFGEF